MRVDQDVLSALNESVCSGSMLTLTRRLDRKLYSRVARVIEAAGGRWNRRAGAHLFEAEAADTIEPILLTGMVTDAKQELDAFDTPPDLAPQVVAKALIAPGMLVLEPSAGTGNLAVPAIEAGAEVHTVEIDPRRAAGLAMRIAKLAAPAASKATGRIADVLTMSPAPIFDRVIMNPPFARQDDIRHVRHAVRFLKPGGRLVAIMSTGVRFRANRLAAEFRLFLEAQAEVEIEDLPPGSFRASGTMVNACLVTIGAGT